MSEVTHGERTALVISDVSDIMKLDSLNRESYNMKGRKNAQEKLRIYC